MVKMKAVRFMSRLSFSVGPLRRPYSSSGSELVRSGGFFGRSWCDMLRDMKRLGLKLNMISKVVLSLALLACEEEKAPGQAGSLENASAEKKEEPEPEPVVESPPHLVITEDGLSVRGTSVEGGKKSGTVPTAELDRFKNYLEDEKKFIEGKELRLVVDRKAKRGWVATYLTELEKLGAAKVTIATETRKDYKGEQEFLLPGAGSTLDGCVLIGQVTKHNGSALWQAKGGTARERGPGLGGPDLSMAQEVFQKNYEACESDVFVTDGANDKDWGFIFDMAAAAVATPEVTVKRALLPAEPQTAGRPAKF